MAIEDEESAWSIVALGDASPVEKGGFYDALAEDDEEEHFSLFGNGEEVFYENPRLEVTILGADGSLVPAAKYPRPAGFSSKSINLYLDRYYVHVVPGRLFDLQVSISSRHMFSGRGQ